MERFIQVDGEWSMMHLPEQPNGFAILMIGDTNQYVNQSTSSWIQSPQRYEFIETLRHKGYTVFYTNGYGANWGSPKAVDLLQRLYQLVSREEILNKQIHLLAEGMGGITALKLANLLEENVRSIAMLSPCLDLQTQAKKERETRLFYKRFIKELAQAYDVEENGVEEKIVAPFDLAELNPNMPIKIWHATDRVPYMLEDHSRKFEKMRRKTGKPIELSLHLFEKRFSIGPSVYRFFEKHEKNL